MFDFGNANDGQRKAIAAADGPVLITAGPGTGKTYTLVQRAIYLIEECNVRPESIFIATFTEKAAKELVTRITNELANRNITANINEMYIGTFHSLCLRMLKEHLEYTRLRRNYRLMDSFDQQYMVFQNIHRFRSIPEIEIVLPNGGAWKQAETICRSSGANKTSLRDTINLLAENTSIVACYNYTGTPYVKNQLLPEVVYAYGLRESIWNGFLKDADPIGFENVKNEEFLTAVVRTFWER